jgi:hypothetical protein
MENEAAIADKISHEKTHSQSTTEAGHFVEFAIPGTASNSVYIGSDVVPIGDRRNISTDTHKHIHTR